MSGAKFQYAEFGSTFAISDQYLAIGAASKTGHRNKKMKVGEVYLYAKNAGKWELNTILSSKNRFAIVSGIWSSLTLIAASTYGLPNTTKSRHSRQMRTAPKGRSQAKILSCFLSFCYSNLSLQVETKSPLRVL